MWRKRNLNDKMTKDLQQLAESYCIYDWNSRCLRSFDVDEVRQIQLNIMYTKKTLYEFGIESKILNESEEIHKWLYGSTLDTIKDDNGNIHVKLTYGNDSLSFALTKSDLEELPQQSAYGAMLYLLLTKIKEALK